MLCLYGYDPCLTVFGMELRMTTTFPDVSISTERLVLRPFEEADIAAHTEMMNDELVTAWTSVPHPYTTQDSEDWVRRIAPAERAEGRGIVLAGGGALLTGLADRLREETQMPVQLAESPLTCVAVGSGRSLEEFEVIHRSAKARQRNGRRR